MLDIHPASDAEREAAYRNVHDVWSGGLPLDEHLRRRLASPKHQRAAWFVGCEDGRVVTSLGCYAVAFRIAGKTTSGVAIGSVHTPEACRGQGFASKLVAWVDDYQRSAGVGVSMLYSDIPVTFYERLGYLTCPCFAGWVMLASKDHASDAEKSGSDALVAFRPADELAQMAGLYSGFHAQLPISIERSDDYWRHLLERQRRDEFFWLSDGSRQAVGYVRLSTHDGELKISDYALAAHDEELARRLYAAVIDLAAARGIKRVGGWLPRRAAAQALFDVSARRQEITMLKPLDEDLILDAESLASTDHFCEIDHV